MIPDIPTDLVKKRAKELSTPQMKVTFNDIILTAISKTVKDYLKEKTDDKNREQINFAVPFSMRKTPQAVGDFNFNNDVSLVPLKVPLVDSMTDGLKRINHDMTAMKSSIDPIIFYYLNKFVNFFPVFVRKAMTEDSCEKMTLGFSNVPGPK